MSLALMTGSNVPRSPDQTQPSASCELQTRGYLRARPGSGGQSSQASKSRGPIPTQPYLMNKGMAGGPQRLVGPVLSRGFLWRTHINNRISCLIGWLTAMCPVKAGIFIIQRPSAAFSPLGQQSAKDRTLIYGCVCVCGGKLNGASRWC